MGRSREGVQMTATDEALARITRAAQLLLDTAPPVPPKLVEDVTA